MHGEWWWWGYLFLCVSSKANIRLEQTEAVNVFTAGREEASFVVFVSVCLFTAVLVSAFDEFLESVSHQ